MKESLYSRRSNLVVGFHGCDKSVVDAVIAGKTELLASANDYEWLGSGIYFWENNEDRAWQWAKQLSTRKSSSVKEPAVIGAIIDLGYCLDLTDSFLFARIKKLLILYSKNFMLMLTCHYLEMKQLANQQIC